MPVITDPNEPYFKDGIWGWHGAGDRWMPLAIDPGTGYLYVLPRGDLEVHQTTPADMRVATHGWDGTAWRPLPIVWGYSDTYNERIPSTNVPAAELNVDFTPVDPGEIHRITRIVCLCHQGTTTAIAVIARIALINHYITRQTSPGSWKTLDVPCDIVLKEDDFIRVTYSTPALNDDFETSVFGYMMLIAE